MNLTYFIHLAKSIHEGALGKPEHKAPFVDLKTHESDTHNHYRLSTSHKSGIRSISITSNQTKVPGWPNHCKPTCLTRTSRFLWPRHTNTLFPCLLIIFSTICQLHPERFHLNASVHMQAHRWGWPSLHLGLHCGGNIPTPSMAPYHRWNQPASV